VEQIRVNPGQEFSVLMYYWMKSFLKSCAKKLVIHISKRLIKSDICLNNLLSDILITSQSAGLRSEACYFQ